MLTRAYTKTIAIALGGAAVLALAGCTAATTTTAPTPERTTSASDPAVSQSAPSTSTATATATAAPEPSPTSTIPNLPGSDYDGGAIPSHCSGLVSAATYKKTLAGTPLNDPAVVGDPPKAPKTAFTPVLQNGGASIYCVWRDPRADITNLAIQVQTVNSAKAFAELQKLPAQGYSCKRESEGYLCQKLGKDDQYGVDLGDTYFTRGDIGIRITQANFPTSGLLDEVEEHVF